MANIRVRPPSVLFIESSILRKHTHSLFIVKVKTDTNNLENISKLPLQVIIFLE